jgi:uncharacterized protein (DUF2147 family)
VARVAITGLGAVSALGHDALSLWFSALVIRLISCDRAAAARLRAAALTAAACLAVAFADAAAADELSPFGRWLTEDRQGVVEIYPCGRELCGKVVWEAEPFANGAPTVDDKNPDPSLRGRSICNLQIMNGFKAKSPAEWVDGAIYEPQSGKTYSAELTVSDAATMKLRGYVGMSLFGSTEVWTRDTQQRPPCSSGS